MKSNELTSSVVDPKIRRRNIERLRKSGVALPKFAQLADAATIPQGVQDDLASVDPDAPHPLNLFRVHWYNSRRDRSFVRVPEHVVLPSELTGVDAKIVV